MDLAVAVIAFGAIFVVELPDKTFIAALVLSTRYRAWSVWLGVGAAFLVQTLIAVTVGNIRQTLVKEGVYTIDQICTPELRPACHTAGLL